jgi:hypothetical protein
VLSGGLFAYLFNHKAKGLLVPEGPICSARDEVIVEAERRFNVFPSREDRVLRQKMPWQKEEARKRGSSPPSP